MFLNSKRKLRLKTMTVYRNDIVIEYKGENKDTETSGKRKQGALSAKSIKNLTFYAQNTSVNFVAMVTLTYPNEYPTSGREVKTHLNTFLSWCRFKYDDFSYLWFLEFQRRGAPHFHILSSVDLTGDRQEISIRWYQTVKSGDKKHLKAGTRTEKLRKVDGAARYATAYASKLYQKSIPAGFRDVGRWWGASRDVKPIPRETYNISGMTGEQLQEAMKVLGWPYSESLRKPLSILYNAGQLISDV